MLRYGYDHARLLYVVLQASLEESWVLAFGLFMIGPVAAWLVEASETAMQASRDYK